MFKPVSYIDILWLHLPVYGLCWLAGIIVAGGLGFILIKKRKIHHFDYALSALYVIVGALVGSKLLFILVSFQEIIELGLSIWEVFQGGFVFYGGLIGGFLGLLLYCRIHKIKAFEYMDVYAAVVPIGHAIGRIGCHAAGCCYGIPYDGPFSVVYTEVDGAHGYLNTPLLPIQLIEALSLALLFVALMILFYRAKKKGVVTAVYFVGYAVIRFVLEFFRGDKERGILFGLSTSQWISILIVIGVVLYFVLSSRKKTEAAPEEGNGSAAEK